jgi:DNA-binding MarR family transcriptional regulator
MNHAIAEQISIDLVRALRGRRSRAAFSRRLGYRSNVAHRWETAAAWPVADVFLERISRLDPRGRDLLSRFLAPAGRAAPAPAPLSPAAVAAFLRELRGKTPLSVLAERSGYSRFRVGRWLSGRARPRLPEFLCLVEATSRRLLDLLAGIVDPARLPSVAARWRALQTARELAYESPWSHAVLRALELEGYRRDPSPAWLAERLGIGTADVERGLAELARSGQVRRDRGRVRIRRVQAVDTGGDPERARKLKATWSRTAIDRLEAGAPGSFGYSVFAISRHDLQRLRALHLEYVRAMRTLIAGSQPSECVGLYCAQLLDFGTVDNALR